MFKRVSKDFYRPYATRFFLLTVKILEIMIINIYDDNSTSAYTPITVKISKGFYEYIQNVYNWDQKIPEQQNVIIYQEAQRDYFCFLLREKRKEAKTENEKRILNKYIAEHDFRGSNRDFFPNFEKQIEKLY